jgi:hypothetical protein
MAKTDVVGISYQVFDKGKVVASGAPAPVIGVDDWVTFRPNLVPVHKHTYTVRITAGSIHGDFTNRVLTLITR